MKSRCADGWMVSGEERGAIRGVLYLKQEAVMGGGCQEWDANI